MSLYALKPAFSRLLSPAIEGLFARGVTPNGVTWSAVGLSAVIGGGIAAAYVLTGRAELFLLLPLAQLFRMALNAIDGAMARRYNLQSDAGAMLNECSDVVNDALIALPFFLVSGLSPTLLAAFLFVSFFGEFVGVLAWAVRGERRYDGPLSKADRALAMSVLAGAIGFGLSLKLWADVFVACLLVLAAVTVVRRVRAALMERAS